MIAQYCPKTACQYLFGEEATQSIYKAYQPSFSQESVDGFLETIMKINVLFLSRKENDGFTFIDPVANNNQCHLYAYLTGRIKENYKEKNSEEKAMQTEDHQFLHLSFLLSFTFLSDRSLLNKTIEAAHLKKEIELLDNEKQVKDFIKHEATGDVLVRAARLSLNQLFERKIKELFAAHATKSPLHREIYQISLEDLQLSMGRSKTSLYTLPKLVGVAFIIEEKISCVIKTKVMSKIGTDSCILYQTPYPENGDSPVLVFEAVTSNEHSIESFTAQAKRCPNYFERNPSKKNRHKETESCQFCNPTKIDLKDYSESFKHATSSINEAFYALAADFIREAQPSFLQFFQNKEKYPLLSEIFERAIANIEPLGLSMKKPIAFTIDHVYVDSAKHAYTPQLRLNSSPEAFLSERNFL